MWVRDVESVGEDAFAMQEHVADVIGIGDVVSCICSPSVT
jgi:hypothetical protein